MLRNHKLKNPLNYFRGWDFRGFRVKQRVKLMDYISIVLVSDCFTAVMFSSTDKLPHRRIITQTHTSGQVLHSAAAMPSGSRGQRFWWGGSTAPVKPLTPHQSLLAWVNKLNKTFLLCQFLTLVNISAECAITNMFLPSFWRVGNRSRSEHTAHHSFRCLQWVGRCVNSYDFHKLVWH